MSAHSTTHPATGNQEHLLHDEAHGGPKLYGMVLGALLVLTAITVAASRLDFGSNFINVVIAMVIASIKGSLVALFFMHLRWDKPISGIIFCVSLFFLGLFLITCYTDVISRPPLEPTNIKVLPGGAVQIPGGIPVAPANPAQGGGTSPSSGGPVIPGASPEGAHGGAAAGAATPPVAPPQH